MGLNFKIVKLITDHNDGRCIYADLSINDSVFNILNIYAPTADRPCQPNFFRRLKNIILNIIKNSSSKLIIGGDFNCVINSELDRKREAEAKSTSKDYSTVSGELIDILKDTLDLSDAWRVKNPDKSDLHGIGKSQHLRSLVSIIG